MPGTAGVAANVLSAIEVRTVGALNGVYLYPLAATQRTYLRVLARVGVIVPIVIALGIARYAATVSRIERRRALQLMRLLLATLAWFEALSSQTQYHLTVSSRSAAAARTSMRPGRGRASARRAGRDRATWRRSRGTPSPARGSSVPA